MTKTLTPHGNSMALVIDKPILKQMGVDEITPLTLAFDGRCLIIARAPAAPVGKWFVRPLMRFTVSSGTR